MAGREESEKRIKAKLAIYAVASVLMMLLIFTMSSQVGEVSQSESDPIAEFLARLFILGYTGLATSDQQAFFHICSVLVRKSGHVAEYAALSACVCAAVRQSLLLRSEESVSNGNGMRQVFWKAAGIGIAISIAYAATDEFHQLFVPGRAGLATDVLVDSIGIIVAALFTTAIAWKLVRRHAEGTKAPQ